MVGENMSTPILTTIVGTNADLIPNIFTIYAKDGDRIADVTYGKGVFWQKIDIAKYDVLLTDMQNGVDFRALPYEPRSIDILILDPPYMHGGGKPIKESIAGCYKNNDAGINSHEGVLRLYGGGILEAARVLKKGGGKIIVKTQDEIESGMQRLSHVEIINLLQIFGFRILDIFILVQGTIPAMRADYQKSARKNSSYAIVAEFRR